MNCNRLQKLRTTTDLSLKHLQEPVMDNVVKSCEIKIHHFGSLFENSGLSLISISVMLSSAVATSSNYETSIRQSCVNRLNMVMVRGVLLQWSLLFEHYTLLHR